MTDGPVQGHDFIDPEGPGHSDASPLLATAEQRATLMVRNFQDPTQEWRRLIAELVGTFFLVLVAAGGPMIDHAIPGSVGRAAAVVAPGMMVMSIILFMGRVSGAHLNPAVSLAFWMRRDFPGRRVPAYVVVQFAGAVLAAWFLQVVVHVSASHGANYPAPGTTPLDSFLMETVLTLGLVSVILGTASGAQQVGLFGAIGVGSYIALAGLWASPISGASMNPARTLGPDLVSADLTSWWVYVAGPLLGAVLAVGLAWLLRGPGGGKSGSLAAQGSINPRISRPGTACRRDARDGRRRRLVVDQGLGRAQPLGHDPQEPHGQGRGLPEHLLELALPQHQEGHLGGADHRRRPWSVVQQGELAEEVARTERGDGSPPAPDRGGAGQDDEEEESGLALFDQERPRGHGDLRHRLVDPAQLGLGATGEQPDPREVPMLDALVHHRRLPGRRFGRRPARRRRDPGATGEPDRAVPGVRH